MTDQAKPEATVTQEEPTIVKNAREAATHAHHNLDPRILVEVMCGSFTYGEASALVAYIDRLKSAPGTSETPAEQETRLLKEVVRLREDRDRLRTELASTKAMLDESLRIDAGKAVELTKQLRKWFLNTRRPLVIEDGLNQSSCLAQCQAILESLQPAPAKVEPPSGETERCPYSGFRGGEYYCHRNCALCHGSARVPVEPKPPCATRGGSRKVWAASECGHREAAELGCDIGDDGLCVHCPNISCLLEVEPCPDCGTDKKPEEKTPSEKCPRCGHLWHDDRSSVCNVMVGSLRCTCTGSTNKTTAGHPTSTVERLTREDLAHLHIVLNERTPGTELVFKVDVLQRLLAAVEARRELDEQEPRPSSLTVSTMAVADALGWDKQSWSDENVLAGVRAARQEADMLRRCLDAVKQAKAEQAVPTGDDEQERRLAGLQECALNMRDAGFGRQLVAYLRADREERRRGGR